MIETVAFRSVIVRGSGDGHFDQVVTVKLVRLIEVTIADGVKSDEFSSIYRDTGAANRFLILLTRLGKRLDQDPNKSFDVLSVAHLDQPPDVRVSDQASPIMHRQRRRDGRICGPFHSTSGPHYR